MLKTKKLHGSGSSQRARLVVQIVWNKWERRIRGVISICRCGGVWCQTKNDTHFSYISNIGFIVSTPTPSSCLKIMPPPYWDVFCGLCRSVCVFVFSSNLDWTAVICSNGTVTYLTGKLSSCSKCYHPIKWQLSPPIFKLHKGQTAPPSRSEDACY